MFSDNVSDNRHISLKRDQKLIINTWIDKFTHWWRQVVDVSCESSGETDYSDYLNVSFKRFNFKMLVFLLP